MSDYINNLSEFLEFPVGWKVVALEEIIKEGKIGLVRSATEQSFDKGYSYIRMQHYDLKGNWNFTDLTRVLASPEEFKIYELQEGDILFNTRNSYELVGKVAIWTLTESGYLYNNNLLRLRFFDGVLPKWIGYQMMSPAFRNCIGASKSATTSVCAIYGKDLNSQPILLSPLNEQRRIVAKIEALKARSRRMKEALTAIPLLLDQFRQSVLAAAFRGDLTADWREKNPDVEPASDLLDRIQEERIEAEVQGKIRLLKRPNIPKPDYLESPQRWELILSHELFLFVTSGSRGWAKYYSDAGAIFIRVGNLNRQSIYLDLNFIQRVNPPSGAEGTRTRVQSGDVLISITADIGMIAVVPENIPEAYINQHVALARPLAGFSVQYVAWYLATSEGGFKQLQQLQRGATKVGLGLDDIRSVWIPFPPLEEQKEIVRQIEFFFSAAEKIERQYQEAKAQIDQLDQSILAKAFRGELVSQDPNDEPASVLLERIQAERAKREAEAKTAKKSIGKTTGQRSRKAKQQESESIQLGLPGVE